MQIVKGYEITLVGLLIAIVVGGVIGFVASTILKGGLGLVGDVVVGIVGALIAGFLLPRIGLSLGGGYLGAVLIDAIGALVLVVASRALRR